MRETRISYQLTIHPDPRAQRAILDLTKSSGDRGVAHPLYPFILLREDPALILYPLAQAIHSPVKPLLFDSILGEPGDMYLTSSDAGFNGWRKRYRGFLIHGGIDSFDPVEVVDWRGRITLMEITEEEGRIVRYRWDILHDFHLV